MPRKTECSCEKCKECCTREAGWFLPEEVPLAAQYLSLSEADFIEQFCKKHDLDGKGIALSPKAKPNSTECIFLENGLCKIHEVKPYECRKVFACEPARRHSRIREFLIKEWT